MLENHHKSDHNKTLLSTWKKQLQQFTIDYLRDHDNKCHAKEEEALNRLRRIAKDVDNIEQNETALATVNIMDELNRIIERLNGITPPKEWIERKTSGFIFETTVENKIVFSLHDSMKSLIGKFEEKRVELKKTESENPAIKELRQEMELLHKNFKDAYQNAKKEGADEFKQELIIRVQKMLPPTLQEGILLLLEGKEPLPLLAYPSASASEAQPEPPRKIKSEEDEMEKAKKFMGEAKFLVAKELVTHFDKLSPREKLIAKLLIFQLMAHKHDKTIKEIISNIKELLVKQCGIAEAVLADKFPQLIGCLVQHKDTNDLSTPKPLAKYEVEAFHQLVNDKAIYFPVDGTAANYFGAKFEELNGKSNTNPISDKTYITNFLKKFNHPSFQNTFKASSKETETFTPPAQLKF